VPPRALIGKSTVDAIRCGIIYCFAGQVDGIIGRLRDELGPDTQTIATGGLGEHIVPFTGWMGELDGLLTVKGLRIIHERAARAYAYIMAVGVLYTLDDDPCDD